MYVSIIRKEGITSQNKVWLFKISFPSFTKKKFLTQWHDNLEFSWYILSPTTFVE